MSTPKYCTKHYLPSDLILLEWCAVCTSETSSKSRGKRQSESRKSKKNPNISSGEDCRVRKHLHRRLAMKGMARVDLAVRAVAKMYPKVSEEDILDHSEEHPWQRNLLVYFLNRELQTPPHLAVRLFGINAVRDALKQAGRVMVSEQGIDLAEALEELWETYDALIDLH